MLRLEDDLVDVEPARLALSLEAMRERLKTDDVFAFFTEHMAFCLCGEPLEEARAFLVKSLHDLCALEHVGEPDRAYYAAHALTIWRRLLDMTKKAGMA